MWFPNFHGLVIATLNSQKGLFWDFFYLPLFSPYFNTDRWNLRQILLFYPRFRIQITSSQSILGNPFDSASLRKKDFLSVIFCFAVPSNDNCVLNSFLNIALCQHTISKPTNSQRLAHFCENSTICLSKLGKKTPSKLRLIGDELPFLKRFYLTTYTLWCIL